MVTAQKLPHSKQSVFGALSQFRVFDGHGVGQALGMYMASERFEQTRLWCVELIPKKEPLSEAKMMEMVKGMPNDPDGALLWMAQVVVGIGDERDSRFARQRQRLLVFRLKAQAAKLARKKTNEFWTGKVREVKVV